MSTTKNLAKAENNTNTAAVLPSSCLPHDREEKFLMLRQPFIEICEGDACAAALLSIFERWTNSRIEQERKGAAHRFGRWIYKTRDDLRRELLGAYSLTAIIHALKFLCSDENADQGTFLKVRKNPLDAFDRTQQFLLQIEVVCAALAEKRKSMVRGSANRALNPAIAPLDESRTASLHTEKTITDKTITENTLNSSSSASPESSCGVWPDGSDEDECVLKQKTHRHR